MPGLYVVFDLWSSRRAFHTELPDQQDVLHVWYEGTHQQGVRLPFEQDQS